ncbi:hypothetical protein AA0114_g10252 [Alternaria tenuissima]|uniref:Heterokaryon incompatibility domain-containing protein n=1 Tax=Alternaria tenuissima TaxID=119927 RepID=A0A4Q4M7A6_9PLEO|nr:hypothetical protein AA0114_g10252 [Alternaria tenuissima]
MNAHLPPKTQRFRYRPLDNTSGQIRLIRIQPGLGAGTPMRLLMKTVILRDEDLVNDRDDLKVKKSVHLHHKLMAKFQTKSKTYDETFRKPAIEDTDVRTIHAKLSEEAPRERPHFTSLSYRWGDESIVHEICIQDNDNIGWFSTYENLYNFLLIKQDQKTSDAWYWIDQISIDQKNDQEKSHQVSRMSALYLGADKVEVWLGPAYEESDELMDFISSFKQASRQPNDETVEKHLPALQAFLELEYWNRLWIVQEIKLGQNRLIRLGRKVVSWLTELEPALAFVESWFKAPRPLSLLGHKLYILAGLGIRELFVEQDYARGTWEEMGSLSVNRHCGKVVDRVYATMSLVAKPLRFYPDYSKSIQDVLLTLLQMHLEFELQNDNAGTMSYVARSWLNCLDRGHEDIDIKVIRRWLASRAHVALRAKRQEQNVVDRMFDKPMGPFMFLFGVLGYGPTWVARVRLWWEFPSKGSIRYSRWPDILDLET